MTDHSDAVMKEFGEFVSRLTYHSCPRSDSFWNAEQTHVPSVTAIETTPAFEQTGLLDRHGVPLVRPKPAIGFTDFSKLRRTS